MRNAIVGYACLVLASVPAPRISAGHPDADDPLVHAAARALAGRGAWLWIDARGENLVRRDASGAVAVIVEAQGVGNLVHELVHAIQAGVLDDDHGIDYARIPLSLDEARDRALLWDELAACVISCAYLEAPTAAIDAWFAEQLETQPVFYGMERELGAFARALDDRVGDRGPERATLDAVVEGAYATLATWLEQAGAPPRVAHPALRLRFASLWARYRAHRPAWFPEREAHDAPGPDRDLAPV